MVTSNNEIDFFTCDPIVVAVIHQRIVGGAVGVWGVACKWSYYITEVVTSWAAGWPRSTTDALIQHSNSQVTNKSQFGEKKL